MASRLATHDQRNDNMDIKHTFHKLVYSIHHLPCNFNLLVGKPYVRS